MIKKLSGNSLSSWLKVACKNYLLASDEYDKLGQYSLSSEVYENVLKLSSLIRLSEDESVEEDVDFKILDSDSVNEGDISEHSVIERKNDTGSSGYYSFSYPTIEMFVKILRSGGKNVFRCLDNVAKDKVARYEAAKNLDELDFDSEIWEKNNLAYALAWYFNNDLFHHYSTNLDVGQVINDIWNDRVSIDTVACFVRVEKEQIEKNKIWNQGRASLREFIGRIYPEFMDDVDLQNYFLPIFMSDNLKISEIQQFDIENFKRFKLLKSRINKPIRSDFVYSILKFLSKYPSDEILSDLIEKINNSNNIHSLSGFDYEKLLFGTSLEVSEFVSRTEYFEQLINKISKYKYRNNFNFNEYNFLCLLYSEDEALRIYSEYNLNNVLDVKGYWKQSKDSPPIDKYLHDVGGNEIVSDKEYKENKSYPYLNAFVRAGGKVGRDVFNYIYYSLIDKVYDHLKDKEISDFNNCFNYMIPVFIKYFSPVVKHFSPDDESSKVFYFGANKFFVNFTKVYALVGEEIYNYKLHQIFRIADNYSSNLELKSDMISIEQYKLACEKLKGTPYEDFEQIYYLYPFSYNIPVEKILNLRWSETVSETLKDLCDQDDRYYIRIIANGLFDHNSNKFFSGEIKKLFLDVRINPAFEKDLRNLELSYVNDSTKEILGKILTQDKIIGNLEELLKNASVFNLYPDLSPSEFYFSRKKINSIVDLELVNKIREEFQKHSKYKDIEIGSERYNKIFGILANNFAIRGTDPDLLEKLYDISVVGHNHLLTSTPNLHFVASILGTNNLKYLSEEDVIKINNAFISLYIKEEDFCKKLKLKPEWIINLGGFEKFFSMSDNELVEFANSHRILSDTDVQELRSQRSLFRQNENVYSTFLLKCDKNILKNKLYYLFFQKYFKENPIDINLLRSKDNENNSLIDVNIFRSTFQKFGNDMYKEFLCGRDCDKKLQELYNMQVLLYKDIIYPEKIVDEAQFSLDLNSEGIKNLSRIIQVFRKFTYEILNAYSKEECKGKGYPVRGYDAIPDIRLKERIIHDLANLLPDNLPDRPLVGYSQYFYNNFLQDKKKNLKMIGNMWNSVMNIYDSDYNVVNSGTVGSFSSLYSIDDLAKLIRIDSFTKLFSQLEVNNKDFGLSFAEYIGIEDKSGNVSSSDKVLYSGLEKVYIDGLSVEMPSWSGFKSTDDGLTLRFLPRKDARGMFLGIITGCCQNPRGQAASCAYDGHLNPLACFAVFEKNNEIIFQSYVWSDNEGNVCFDSIETADRNYYKQQDLLNSAKTLIIEFSKSINGRCTVGSNNLGFDKRVSRNDKLYNPTITNDIDYVSELLIDYSVNGNRSFYSSDSEYQYQVQDS